MHKSPVPPPWEDVVARSLDTTLQALLPTGTARVTLAGHARVFDDPLTLRALLLAVADRDVATRQVAKGGEWEGSTVEDAISDQLLDAGFEELLETCAGTTVESLITCGTPNSMVSGMWGLRTFSLGSRGYIYSFPDESLGILFDDYPIWGAWGPIDSFPAFEACVVGVYVATWDMVGLPPFQGQCVDGPFRLMVKGMLEASGPSAFLDWDPKSRIISDVASLVDIGELPSKLGIESAILDELLEEIRSTGSVPERLTEERATGFLGLCLETMNCGPRGSWFGGSLPGTPG